MFVLASRAAVTSLARVERAPFDRVAEIYDETRGLPAETIEGLTSVLADELSDQQPALEVGVGTGRIAVPLRQRGVELVGIDLAPAMLGRLAAKAGQLQLCLPLVLGDATRLPLTGGSFGAVLFSHFLHLLPGWRVVVEEALRVTRPGGVLLVDFGEVASSPWSAEADEILRRHGVAHERPGASNIGELAEYLAGRARVRQLQSVPATATRSLAMDIAEWTGQIHSWTWPHPPERMTQAALAVQSWAAEQGWPLDRPVRLEWAIQWWALDL